MNHHPFPVYDLAVLDSRAQDTWRSTTSRVPLPGELKRLRPRPGPHRVNTWPDITAEDAAAAGPESTFMVPANVVVLVLGAAHDSMGNAWCLVVADGRLGFVAAVDLEALEEHTSQHGQAGPS